MDTSPHFRLRSGNAHETLIAMLAYLTRIT
ncbi:hypothetical protein SAMN04489711_11786 [Paracidovorax wautersii]|uniref:Uncharacterized protein n=1 Tax=Paracidovorax wautersii TaxID=1177982 RepID=A0A1I2GYM2_9BURK|nr:hypothetical protein SAMN04489711_11786 [Paracidovorax wautersii]